MVPIIPKRPRRALWEGRTEAFMRPEATGIELRLARLERSHRRMRIAFAALLASAPLLVVLSGQGQRNPDGGVLVEAQRFVVRDTAGAVRARLMADQQGRISLTLFDKDERTRAALGVASDGSPVLVFGDPDGRTTRLELSVKPDGTTAIGLGDGKGRFRSTMEVKADGSSHVFLLDADGRPRGDVGLLPNGDPVLAFSDGNARVRTRITTDGESGAPSLTMLDADGRTRAAFGMFPDKSWGIALGDAVRAGRARFAISGDGSPSLSLADRDGRPRASLNFFSDATNLLLYDKAGKSRVQLGVWPDGVPALSLYDAHGEALWSSP